MRRLYRAWLQFLRYANAIDLHAATASGNLVEKMWLRNRIAQLDMELDRERIASSPNA